VQLSPRGETERRNSEAHRPCHASPALTAKPSPTGCGSDARWRLASLIKTKPAALRAPAKSGRGALRIDQPRKPPPTEQEFTMSRNTLSNVRRHYTPPATAEQRATITALGGRPPAYLTPSQAQKAISTLRLRAATRARRAGVLATANA
jgi:hypothetical protein